MSSRIGKLWTDAVAYVALATGAGLSIAGNVADTFRTRGQYADTLDIILAVSWPALVVLMVEVFVSSRWRGLAWPMQILRWLGCLSIGAMAMRVSWVHLNDLLASRGQEADVATLGPLAIDFLAIMATALILAGRGQDTPRLLATPLAVSSDELDTIVAKWTAAPVANPYLDMATAIGDQLASEARTWLDSLDDAVQDGQPSTLPVPVSPGPQDTTEVGQKRQGRLSAADSEAARGLAAQYRQDGLKAGDISETLAMMYGVSARTIRRQAWWVETMAGKTDDAES